MYWHRIVETLEKGRGLSRPFLLPSAAVLLRNARRRPCPHRSSRGTNETQAQESGFTKPLGSDATLLSADPLIGLLELETDTGQIELAMNRVVAERLMSTLVEFLQSGEGDDAPRFAVERSQ
jgi:hypothetical protein